MVGFLLVVYFGEEREKSKGCVCVVLQPVGILCEQWEQG